MIDDVYIRPIKFENKLNFYLYIIYRLYNLVIFLLYVLSLLAIIAIEGILQKSSIILRRKSINLTWLKDKIDIIYIYLGFPLIFLNRSILIENKDKTIKSLIDKNYYSFVIIVSYNGKYTKLYMKSKNDLMMIKLREI